MANSRRSLRTQLNAVLSVTIDAIQVSRNKTSYRLGARKRPLGKDLRKSPFFIPKANPGYDSNMHLIDRWLIEFDENDDPWREIGLSKSGEVVVAGPSDRDYGFWCDTNMKYSDFDGEEVSESVFEDLWSKSKTFRSDDA